MDENPNYVNGMINFAKRTLISSVLSNIIEYQQTGYAIHPVPQVLPSFICLFLLYFLSFFLSFFVYFLLFFYCYCSRNSFSFSSFICYSNDAMIALALPFLNTTSYAHFRFHFKRLYLTINVLVLFRLFNISKRFIIVQKANCSKSRFNTNRVALCANRSSEWSCVFVLSCRNSVR